jgi:predicted aconitase with swiveling domain/8-oxo-dGTP pyrophosphatase MutT (NUDIX family)
MKIKGRAIFKGKAIGRLLVLNEPFSFLGGVDPGTGVLTVASGREGESIEGRILVFPYGKGSTVGSYTLLDLKKNGHLPAAIVNSKAETIVATGAVMAGVPMVDSLDISLLRDGDRVLVDGDSLDMMDLNQRKVVTCILRCKGKMLLLKRSQKVGTNKGKWAGVSGFIERGDTPEETALKEVAEETGITAARIEGRGEVLRIRDGLNIWSIYPFLFDVDDEGVKLDWEHTESAWIDMGELTGYDTVPGFAKVLEALRL